MLRCVRVIHDVASCLNIELKAQRLLTVAALLHQLDFRLEHVQH